MGVEDIQNFSLAELENMPQAKIDELNNVRHGEVTYDDLVQFTVMREKIFQAGKHFSIMDPFVAHRPADRLEWQIFASDDEIQVNYPVAPDTLALGDRIDPIDYNKIDVRLKMAETRMFFADDTKLRDASINWTRQDMAQKAAETLAMKRDERIISKLKTAAPAGNTVTANDVWSAAGSTPEDDVAEAVGNIAKNSNMRPDQINAERAFALVLPVDALAGMNKFKLIRNVQTTISEVLNQTYKVVLAYTKPPTSLSGGSNAWPLETQAMLFPISDPQLGFFSTWNGGGVVPAQLRQRLLRGEEIVTRQWMEYTVIPYPLDGSTTTNEKIALINGVA